MQPSKVTIPFLGANGSSSSLQLEEEVSKIQINLTLAKERDNLVFRQEWAVTIDSLLQAILDGKPNMIHFSGHGRAKSVFWEGCGPQQDPGKASVEALPRSKSSWQEPITLT